jgi:3-oxoacyl-[acyl-carrier-protein] synthase-1/3-oxoacyl-[acyl-carrier-protein] synthase II
MRPVRVVAAGAVSPLGVGEAAVDVGEPGVSAQSAIVEDPLLASAGLRRPFAARVRSLGVDASGRWRDRAELLLESARDQLVEGLDRELPDWRKYKLALCVGTSSGGMHAQERAFAERERGNDLDRDLARGACYFGPLSGLISGLGVPNEAVVQVLAACASSTVAIGLGCRWLEAGHADLVIAGGYDALALFVAAGFESLGATSGNRPTPFRAGRDGMALGEGAALLALCRAGEAKIHGLGNVLGFAASSDAVHVTAPDRSGAGLASAARGALEDAGATGLPIDIVSAHGTATPFNDAAEAKAMAQVLGDRSGRAVVHPFKAIIGHTLGAAGGLETLSALQALRLGVLPAALGSGAIEPELRSRLLEQNERGTPRRCLKLSAAFGGANAALVLGRDDHGGTGRERGRVRLLARGEACTALDVEATTGRLVSDPGRLSRLDPVSALAVAATMSALSHGDCPPPGRCGVIVGTAAASIEVNDAFDLRRRRRGARAVEPRRFPATSPNLCAGEVSIAFGLQGPSFSVGAGPAAATEALLVAVDLLEAGDADAFIVVAVDHVGPSVTDIWRAAQYVLPEAGAVAVVLTAGIVDRPVVDSAVVRRIHQGAVASDGRVDGSAPGWPSLLAAVRRLA